MTRLKGKFEQAGFWLSSPISNRYLERHEPLFSPDPPESQAGGQGGQSQSQITDEQLDAAIERVNRSRKYTPVEVRTLLARHNNDATAALEALAESSNRFNEGSNRQIATLQLQLGNREKAFADLQTSNKQLLSEKEEINGKYTTLVRERSEGMVDDYLSDKTSDASLLRTLLESRYGYNLIPEGEGDKLVIKLKKGEEVSDFDKIVNADFFKKHPALSPTVDDKLRDNPLAGSTDPEVIAAGVHQQLYGRVAGAETPK